MPRRRRSRSPDRFPFRIERRAPGHWPGAFLRTWAVCRLSCSAAFVWLASICCSAHCFLCLPRSGRRFHPAALPTVFLFASSFSGFCRLPVSILQLLPSGSRPLSRGAQQVSFFVCDGIRAARFHRPRLPAQWLPPSFHPVIAHPRKNRRADALRAPVKAV